MKTKTVIAACALSVVGAGALAQISFTSTDTVTFTQTFNPDGGIFASGAFTSGNTGFFTAGSDSGFSLTWAEQVGAEPVAAAAAPSSPRPDETVLAVRMLRPKHRR